jgi:rubrerythrin
MGSANVTGAMTGDKVLAMALDMEQTGRDFYTALAAGCGNRQIAALCTRLAQAEATHATTFLAMRKRLAQAGRTRLLTDEQSAQVHAMVKEFMIPKPDAVQTLALHGSAMDAVNMAVKMERDSVRFYRGMVPALPAEDVPVVERIIAEEERHARDLEAMISNPAR